MPEPSPPALKLISYVFPIFNEETNIDTLHQRIAEVTHSVSDKYSFEFIFVDDGSRDGSLNKLLDLAQRDSRVRTFSLSRNYGHQIAVTAGLDVSLGDAVIVMDSDLQDPPEVSIQLIERWEAGADVVFAQRRTRKDSAFKRFTASSFYWVLSRLASIEIPRNTGDFRLLDRRVVEELKKYREHNRFLRGMVSYVGFRQEGVLFDRSERYSGETGYPLRKMIALASDGILGFSTAPIRMISQAGVLVALAALLWTLYLVFSRLFSPTQVVEGWTFLAASIFLLSGIQMIMIGVVGSYVARVYQEVQNRPLYAFKISDSDLTTHAVREENR